VVGLSRENDMTLVWWFAFLAVTIFLLYFPIAHVVLKALRQAYSARSSKYDRVVCLTFDDGPDPASTPAILEILRAQGVLATFFVLGKNAEMHPDVIAAMAEGGHEIGEHGYCHLHPWKSMPWSYLNDLVEGHKTLSRLLGSNEWKRYRPTFGKANALTFVFAWLFRKSLTFWNIDAHDYQEESEQSLVGNVLSQIHEAPGAAIVLLHDGRTRRWQGSASVTAAAVEQICDGLLKEGYQFRTVSELTAT